MTDKTSIEVNEASEIEEIEKTEELDRSEEGLVPYGTAEETSPLSSSRDLVQRSERDRQRQNESLLSFTIEINGIMFLSKRFMRFCSLGITPNYLINNIIFTKDII